ncbi:MAG: 2-isopropylmalate synthase, partial [Campylobacteraceae bacterium]|nr:2-isopropylmalate synthase [Campylobacteraceae bacterium]
HESGIHQDGVLKHTETYEIMSAKDIGLDKNSIVLGKHSGRHAFKDKLKNLGYDLKEEDLNEAFDRFKIVADQKKEMFDDDLRALVAEEITKIPQVFELVRLQLSDCSPGGVPSAAVTIRHNGIEITDAAIGNGTMDAVFKVIDRVCNVSGELKDYKVDAVTQGKDAMARVLVKVVFDDSKPAIMGHGLSVDTMLGTAKAYIGALNSYMSMKEGLRTIHNNEDSI